MFDRPQVNLPLSYCQDIENFVVDRGTLKTRGGTTLFMNFQYPGEIQAFRQFRDLDGTRYLIVVSEGRTYRHAMPDDPDTTDPTELTNSITLSDSTDARYVLRSWNGGVYVSDGINPLTRIADGSSLAALYSANNTGNVPTQAAAMEIFENSLALGDFTDFDDDATARAYGTIISQIGIQDNFPEDAGARNNHNQMAHGRIQALLEESSGDLLIFLEDAVRYAFFQPTQPGLGRALTDYDYRGLTTESGLEARLALADTPNGVYYLDGRGLYRKPRGRGTEPVYVNSPIETFWSGVNDARLPYSCAARIPGLNGVLFCVPHGTNQTQNNCGIFVNYNSWSDPTPEIEDEHPAFSIFKGDDQEPFGFNCLGTIVDTDGRRRCLGGGYDGRLWYIDEGTKDRGQAINYSFTTPRFGRAGDEFTWDNLIVDATASAAKSMAALIRYYGGTDPDTQKTIAPEGGTTGGELGSFMLGTSFLAGDELVALRAENLGGPSRYMDVKCTLTAGDNPISIHQVTVQASYSGPAR